MEATIVCVDNSEHTRNGDYAPTRFQAQADAVNLLAGAKTQHHPENAVGVLSMAGKTPRVLVTPTPDLGKVLSAMQDLRVEGEVRLSTAVQIAQLTLKHRENKNQRQRIVLFIGSPISEDEGTLVRIAKKLKKNNVAVDVVSFGSEEANAGKLEAFAAAVNSNGNSHLVAVPPGTILSDMLFGTPIFMEEGGGNGGEEGGAPPAPRSNVVDGFDYGALGVDPTLDPELALALRVSMEEERARQAAAAQAATAPAGGAEGGEPTLAAGPDEGIDAMDEDALLQQALALSMAVGQPTPAPSSGPAPTPTAPTKPSGSTTEQPAEQATPASAPGVGDEAMLEAEDEELRLALQMSLAETQQQQGAQDGQSKRGQEEDKAK